MVSKESIKIQDADKLKFLPSLLLNIIGINQSNGMTRIYSAINFYNKPESNLSDNNKNKTDEENTTEKSLLSKMFFKNKQIVTKKGRKISYLFSFFVR